MFPKGYTLGLADIVKYIYESTNGSFSCWSDMPGASAQRECERDPSTARLCLCVRVSWTFWRMCMRAGKPGMDDAMRWDGMG